MMTIATLEAEQNDDRFEVFFNEVTETANNIDVEDPILPRRRKIPAKLDDCLEAIPVYSSVSDMYKTYYYEALDIIISNIKQRFQHQGYKMVTFLENLLLKSAKNES